MVAIHEFAHLMHVLDKIDQVVEGKVPIEEIHRFLENDIHNDDFYHICDSICPNFKDFQISVFKEYDIELKRWIIDYYQMFLDGKISLEYLSDL